jgi:hypothetical protein
LRQRVRAALSEAAAAQAARHYLGNYDATRAAADPVRRDIGILAFFAKKEPLRTLELAKLAITQGLAKTLLPGADPRNEAACQRAMGVTLTPYVGESFTARTATERITFRLKKEQGRFGESFPHNRYSFEEVKREPVSENDLGGVVLEEASRSPSPAPEPLRHHRDEINQPHDWEQYEPKRVSQLRQELLADQEVGNDVAGHVAQPDQKVEEGRRA